jgi:Tfp pilus assembly protein PilO
MNSWWLPWLKLAGAWVTAVILCLLGVVFLVWQTSGPMGRKGQIESQIDDLSAEIARLERMVSQAAAERVLVAETGAEIDRISEDVFGSLEERLTAVLREVGAIARGAGLIPQAFGYTLGREEESGGVRFAISFSVDGTYQQVRQLLSGLQASPQFLIIDRISFKGEEDPRSQSLAIRLQVSTYLADAEPEELRALVELLEADGTVVTEAAAEPDAVLEALPTEGPGLEGAAAVEPALPDAGAADEAPDETPTVAVDPEEDA